MKLLRRNLIDRVLEALSDTPVVLIHGARQTGKSTLVQEISRTAYPARYVTLDNATALEAARRDPEGFLTGLGRPVILDEVQRAPALLLAIKSAVDRKRSPGQFLLTGSANVLLLPRLSEVLAGRMEVLTLWPFSQGEIEGKQEGFVDALFEQGARPKRPTGDLDRKALIHRILQGGYPESLHRTTEARRSAWFESYVSTIVHRELRDLANIDHLTEIPRLLRLLASRAGGQMNYAELSSAIALPQTTVKRYLSLLEMLYLSCPVPAWASNVGRRLIKRPKSYLNDTGLVAHLTGTDPYQIEDDPSRLGPLLENFVVMELLKQSAWSRTRPRLLHFRTHNGIEVDAVLESPSGDLVGIEVKAASSLREADVRGLEHLKALVGRRFRRGVVLYMGTEGLPLGDKLQALPMASLWQGQP
jgi:hypothetical protein